MKANQVSEINRVQEIDQLIETSELLQSMRGDISGCMEVLRVLSENPRVDGRIARLAIDALSIARSNILIIDADMLTAASRLSRI